MGGIECHWWKFWRRLRALTEQLPRPVALAGGFEVPTGGSALRAPPLVLAKCQMDGHSQCINYFMTHRSTSNQESLQGLPKYKP
jgi:hypothetical protein